jgi:hypothetical protein
MDRGHGAGHGQQQPGQGGQFWKAGRRKSRHVHTLPLNLLAFSAFLPRFCGYSPVDLP